MHQIFIAKKREHHYITVQKFIQKKAKMLNRSGETGEIIKKEKEKNLIRKFRLLIHILILLHLNIKQLGPTSLHIIFFVSKVFFNSQTTFTTTATATLYPQSHGTISV